MLPVAPTTRTVICANSCRNDLVDRAKRVQRARITDEGQELRRDVDQPHRKERIMILSSTIVRSHRHVSDAGYLSSDHFQEVLRIARAVKFDL